MYDLVYVYGFWMDVPVGDAIVRGYAAVDKRHDRADDTEHSDVFK